MRKIILVVLVSILLFLLTGCVMHISPPGAYPVTTVYAPPVYGTYYAPPVYYEPYYQARPARHHGPTPFETVFGKGALKQPHGKHHNGGNRKEYKR